MASRTLHGVPLSLLLDKIKKEVILLKVSLQVHESINNRECTLKGYKLINEIEGLISSLEKCDNKVKRSINFIRR